MELRTNPRAPFAASLVWPFNGRGALLMLVLVATLGVERFTTWLLASNMVALSSAAVVLLAVLALAYSARHLFDAAEAAADGYDLPPAPPDPREAERVFGAGMGIIFLGFFGFLPLGIASLIGLTVVPVPQILMAAGCVYLPMGIVAVGVTDDGTGAFPTTVTRAILAAKARYPGAAVPGVLAGLGLLVARDGTLSGAPYFLLVVVDAVSVWLLLAAVHRAAVIHRESFEVRAVIPSPVAEVPATEEVATPRRPVSEIERLLMERERASSGPK